MKKYTNVVLLAAIVLAALGMIAAALAFRFHIGAQSKMAGAPVKYDFSVPAGDFKRLQVRGSWKVTVRYGKTKSVHVSVPFSISNRVDATLGKDGLTLANKVFAKSPEEAPTADFVLPELEGVGTSGPAELLIAGFTNERTEINAYDHGLRLTGTDNSWGTLVIRSKGSIFADLTNSVAVNVSLKLAGMSDIGFRMNGGRYEVDAEGMTKIRRLGNYSDKKMRSVGMFSE